MRVLISSQPKIQKHVERLAFAEQPNIDVVGSFTDTVSLLLAVATQRADVVVLSADVPEDRAAVTHLFAEYPDLTVLAFGDGAEVFIEQRCPSRRPLADLSIGGIVGSLRNALDSPCDTACSDAPVIN